MKQQARSTIFCKPTLTRLPAKLALTVLSVALLLAAPINGAQAQTVPDLGAAADFGVLGGTAVTCTASVIAGDVGVAPGTAFTNTGCTIVGAVPPATDAAAFLAQNDLLTAYNALVDQPCTQTILTAAFTNNTPELGPLAPSVYCFPAAVTFTDTTLTLDGSANPDGIWIFKVEGALTGSGFQVVLTNGAQPCNVYWVVGADVTISTSTLSPLFTGTILAAAPTAAGGSITITGGSVVGRVLANTAVTMTGTSVVGCGIVAPTIPPDFCKNFCNECRHHAKHKKSSCNYKKHEKSSCDYKKHESCDYKKHEKSSCEQNKFKKSSCNQGVGNGYESCDPGNSNQGDSDRSNDELGGTPGNPGKKGGNK